MSKPSDNPRPLLLLSTIAVSDTYVPTGDPMPNPSGLSIACHSD